MIPPPATARLQALPVSPAAGFWAIAILTIACAWPVRFEPDRGYLVLAASLVIAVGFFMVLR